LRKDEDARAVAAREVGLVQADEHGGPLLTVQALEAVEDETRGGGVYRGDGLVGEEQFRRVEEGAGDGDALLLAARELVHATVELVADAQVVEDGVDGGAVGGGQVDEVGERAPERHAPQPAVQYVLHDGHAGHEVVLLVDERQPPSQPPQIAAAGALHRLAEHGEVAGGRPQGAHEQAEERRLAAAAWAEQAHELAGFDAHVQPAQAVAAVRIALGEPRRFDHCRHGYWSSPTRRASLRMVS
jgi:hypothetical protein